VTDDKKLIKIEDILFYVPNSNDFIYAEMIETKRLWDIDRIRKYKPALYVELIPDGNRNKRKDNNSQIISLLKVLGYKETEIIGVWKNKNG